MFENLIAIDVGTYSIKVVSAKTGLRDFQIKSFNYEELNASGDPADEIKTAISSILNEESFESAKFITNLPMEKAIIRNISFPFSDVEKIAEAIPFEAEENIPYKMDHLVMDFQTLKSGKENEGRVLISAAHKDIIFEQIEMLNDCGIKPVIMGMEANALFECYKYFSRMVNESVLQIDIGNNKSIINLISDNRLIYARSVSISAGLINRQIADYMGTNLLEATRLFENLKVDLTSIDNNIQRKNFKNLGLSRQRFNKIFDIAENMAQELIEQIFLTLKALSVEYGQVSFNRALLSGGGSNIMGLGAVISRELEMPVMALPFLDEYEPRVQSQFPIAFGTILSYINNKRNYINFLKGEFLPDVKRESFKIYYLAGFFGALSVIILIINIILSLILTAKSNRAYNKVIIERFNSYFRTKPKTDDPILEAEKLLRKEKKEIAGISRLMPEEDSVLDLIKEIMTQLPKSGGFQLANFVVNQRVVRIDASVSEMKSIDDFKRAIENSKKFDVDPPKINNSRKNEISFTLTIKRKIAGKNKQSLKDLKPMDDGL